MPAAKPAEEPAPEGDWVRQGVIKLLARGFTSKKNEGRIADAILSRSWRSFLQRSLFRFLRDGRILVIELHRIINNGFSRKRYSTLEHHHHFTEATQS